MAEQRLAKPLFPHSRFTPKRQLYASTEIAGCVVSKGNDPRKKRVEGIECILLAIGDHKMEIRVLDTRPGFTDGYKSQ